MFPKFQCVAILNGWESMHLQDHRHNFTYTRWKISFHNPVIFKRRLARPPEASFWGLPSSQVKLLFKRSFLPFVLDEKGRVFFALSDNRPLQLICCTMMHFTNFCLIEWNECWNWKQNMNWIIIHMLQNWQKYVQKR